MPLRFDAREFSDYIKLLEELALAEPERAADINMIIESLRALKAEHSRILGVRMRLAKRTKEFEHDCRAALLMVASIAMAR
jgi:hypothetical protein